MKLSKNFSLKELLVTSTGVANIPTEEAKENLKALVTDVLQPLRDKIGRPIIVTSGYRSPEVNEAVGGVPTSQHQSGQAADLTCGNRTLNKILYDAAVELGVYDQIIWENGGLWVHISYRKDGKNRKQQLRIG